MTLHGADVLRLGRFSGAMVNAVLVKALLVNALLSPLLPPVFALLVEVAAEKRERPQLLPAFNVIKAYDKNTYKT